MKFYNKKIILKKKTNKNLKSILSNNIQNKFLQKFSIKNNSIHTFDENFIILIRKAICEMCTL